MMMAGTALRFSCLNTAVVVHRACISASYDSSASSLEPQEGEDEPETRPIILVWRNGEHSMPLLGAEDHLYLVTAQVGRRSFPGRAAELCEVPSIIKTRLVQKAGHMSSFETPRCFSGEAEAELTLAKKKCTPCSSKELRPMTKESTRSLLEQIPGWDLLEVDGQLQLQKNWKAKNFVKGLEFIKSIADVAESEGHHPDLHLVNWNDVKVNIWTHSIGGLSENDFILAAKINTLSGEGFLRKSGAKSKPPTVAT